MSRGEKRIDNFLINRRALRLAIRLVWTTLDDTFIPVETEPAQCIQQLFVGFFRVALGVGVLDAEDERSANVTRVRPVEQASPNQADVRRPRW
ncbi:unannotated protein [freshwater metagenome]|uniref:Unannotated protein n=1 Tax=freshwater metagenome TaxID=449393 RepID=A0A6J6BPT7_9ZZZZ